MTATLALKAIDDTVLARLETEGRLLNPLHKGAMFYVLPIDESTVYNEMLDLLYLEKNDAATIRQCAVITKPSRSENATPNTSASSHPLTWASTMFGLAARQISFADPSMRMLVMKLWLIAKPYLECLA